MKERGDQHQPVSRRPRTPIRCPGLACTDPGGVHPSPWGGLRLRDCRKRLCTTLGVSKTAPKELRGWSVGCDTACMVDMKVPVAPKYDEKIASLAVKIRLFAHHHAATPPPAETSNFGQLRRFGTDETLSRQARGMIDASLEHLVFWADHAAPLQFHPEHETLITLRPYFTLARAALEASAQTVWLLGTVDEREVLRRHISLALWDLDEQKKWQGDPTAKKAIAEERERLASASHEFLEADVGPPRGYLDVIRFACKTLGKDASEVESLWRAASAAAHGKLWLIEEMMTASEMSGFEGILVPDFDAILNTVSVAVDMVQFSVLTFSEWSGADTAELQREAFSWLYANIPLKEGAVRPTGPVQT